MSVPNTRRFSLVNQASYESLINAGTKNENVKNHREQLKELLEDENRMSVPNTRRFSLVNQASYESLINAGTKNENVKNHREQLKELLEDETLKKLNDESVELIWTANTTGTISLTLIISTLGALEALIGAVVFVFKSNEIHINHLETRKEKYGRGWEVFVNCVTTTKQLITAITDLTRQHEELVNIALYHKDTQKKEPWFPHHISELDKCSNCLTKYDPTSDPRHPYFLEPWFPHHISELDKCSNCLTKYDPTSDPRHPGYQDSAYIARRDFLNSIAKKYKHGDPIPIVEYTDEECTTWKEVYEQLHNLRESHTCLAYSGDPIPIVEYTDEECTTWKEVYEQLHNLRESHTCLAYRKNLKTLEDEGVLSPKKIPQLRDVNEFLQRKTGFILRPCAGLLSARDFLASLAFRVFQTTMYIRHSSKPHHSPEPDLIHELLGHVPMFADPMVAQLSQDIGLMSLGVSDEQIEKLATVYWFIIEFGLCREGGELKAIGAGLLSAYGELLHACSDTPEHRDFDPAVTAVQKYEDNDYQPLYFVAHSIKDALIKLRNYALTLERDFIAIYDPFTRSVEAIRHISQIRPAYDRLHADFDATTLAIEKLCIRGF
ncbi:Biopterin-dependent aromatic amino acid hydroxylase [Dictyocaulus viviparus]|uniref:Biopterin-dependent aromatic amino acid hydroxylase n=1 Tax=Dictyocaulus viviparus TaxID=29172 RepID=A0A0D8XRP1_DICVI|nr:Biopterin-dependent aromatic amino acid hydroxylase [Dictyocaulus viviparus]